MINKTTLCCAYDLLHYLKGQSYCWLNIVDLYETNIYIIFSIKSDKGIVFQILRFSVL